MPIKLTGSFDIYPNISSFTLLVQKGKLVLDQTDTWMVQRIWPGSAGLPAKLTETETRNLSGG